MAGILGNRRVLAATLCSAALVGGAYLLARGAAHPPVAEASSETALLAAIATKDSTGDGLPDWQKALYGIPLDATTTDYFNLGMTDGEAVAKGLIVPKAIADVPVATSSAQSVASYDPALPTPAEGTLTLAFAKNFFTLYLSAKQQKGGNLSASDMQDIANQAIAALSGAVVTAPDFKSPSDLTVSGSGTDALAAFAASAERVLAANTASASSSEVVYLNDAVQKGDASALDRIASIAKAYRDSAVGLSALPVPQELASADLDIINALMRTSEIVSDFTRVDSDPLTTMLALQQYPGAIQALGNAFIRVGQVYASAGIALSPGAPGASFVNLIADLAAQQRQGSAPTP